MPINESCYPSNLSQKQQREAMRAVYGLGERPQGNTMMPADLTYEDRARMRRILDEMDAKDAAGAREFDLNKPPVPPYVYREYPYLLYNLFTGKTRAAANYEEKQKMLAEGWSEHPVRQEVPEVELTPQEQMEAADIDKRLEKRKEKIK